MRRRAILAIFTLILAANLQAQTTSTLIVRPDISKLPIGKVSRIIDGDTVALILNDQEHTCRLIGIDAPESVHPTQPVQAFAKESSKFLENLLKGESVWVSMERGGDAKDKYGRLLVYLFRTPDGLFVNLETVRQGYAHAYVKYPFSLMENFREAGKIGAGCGERSVGRWRVRFAHSTAAFRGTPTRSSPTPEPRHRTVK